MSKSLRKLVTVVCEAALEGVLIKDIQRLGARGYTITDARGKGARGVRSASWDAISNIRIEIVCDTATAQAIATYMEEHYYENYAMILVMSDVEVLRPEKF